MHTNEMKQKSNLILSCCNQLLNNLKSLQDRMIKPIVMNSIPSFLKFLIIMVSNINVTQVKHKHITKLRS